MIRTAIEMGKVSMLEGFFWCVGVIAFGVFCLLLGMGAIIMIRWISEADYRKDNKCKK